MLRSVATRATRASHPCPAQRASGKKRGFFPEAPPPAAAGHILCLFLSDSAARAFLGVSRAGAVTALGAPTAAGATM